MEIIKNQIGLVLTSEENTIGIEKMKDNTMRFSKGIDKKLFSLNLRTGDYNERVIYYIIGETLEQIAGRYMLINGESSRVSELFEKETCTFRLISDYSNDKLIIHFNLETRSIKFDFIKGKNSNYREIIIKGDGSKYEDYLDLLNQMYNQLNNYAAHLDQKKQSNMQKTLK